MRKILLIGFAAILIAGLVGAWGTSSLSLHGTVAKAGTFVNPLELMTTAKSLPVEQYDAH